MTIEIYQYILALISVIFAIDSVRRHRFYYAAFHLILGVSLIIKTVIET